MFISAPGALITVLAPSEYTPVPFPLRFIILLLLRVEFVSSTNPYPPLPTDKFALLLCIAVPFVPYTPIASFCPTDIVLPAPRVTIPPFV